MIRTRRQLVGVFAVVAITSTAASVLAQNSPIDVTAWMVGEWTGTSQAGVPFTIAIDSKSNVNYLFGGKTLATGPAEKRDPAVRFTFTNAPGHYVELTPSGPNSGNWMYVGGNTVSRSTITRKR
jgi:hypothetical protein